MNEITHKSPRRFDKEFKLAALELWRTSGKTRKEVADDLGIRGLRGASGVGASGGPPGSGLD